MGGFVTPDFLECVPISRRSTANIMAKSTWKAGRTIIELSGTEAAEMLHIMKSDGVSCFGLRGFFVRLRLLRIGLIMRCGRMYVMTPLGRRYTNILISNLAEVMEVDGPSNP